MDTNQPAPRRQGMNSPNQAYREDLREHGELP